MGQAMLVAQIAMAAMQAKAAQDSANAQSQAATQNAQQEWKEYHRQQQEVTAEAQGEKAERARQADKLVGQMMAVMADNGGAGTSNEAAFAGEIGFLEGLDVARIEGNRRREVDALSAAKIASHNRALNIITSAGTQAQGKIWNIASTAVSGAGRGNNPATTKGDGIGTGGQKGSFTTDANGASTKNAFSPG